MELYRRVAGNLDGGKDEQIAADLEAISRYLEKRLGRFFTKDAAAVARTFPVPSRRGRMAEGWAEAENPWRASGATRVLRIDDLVSVTSIEIDGTRDGTFTTDLVAADYELLPRNATKGPESWPYTSIELTTSGSQWAWTGGANVRITGVWGWPAVPEPIVRGCIELTRILRLESPRATNSFSDFGVVASTNSQARTLIDELVAHYAGEQTVTF